MFNPKSLENLKTFRKGESGNPRGLTKEQAKRRSDNADKAEKLRELQLDGLLKLAAKLTPEDIERLVRADINTIVRDAIEREHGKPGQQLDLLSSDGSAAMPSVIRLVGPSDDE